MMQADGPRFWVGTSGYNYAEWKGSFYPEKFSSKKMLPYYAERLATVDQLHLLPDAHGASPPWMV